MPESTEMLTREGDTRQGGGREMETSGTRQVVDGRLPDSCQSLLIKSVIEMSREAAQEKSKRKQKRKKGRKNL